MIQNAEEYVEHFVGEAQRRDIYRVSDMDLLEHEQYQIKWYNFCDEYFLGKESRG